MLFLMRSMVRMTIRLRKLSKDVPRVKQGWVALLLYCMPHDITPHDLSYMGSL